LGQSGLNLAAYLRLSGQTMEQLTEEMRPRAQQRLVERLILREYARGQSLEINDQELQQGVWNVALSYGERAQEVLEQFHDRRNLLPLYEDLMTQKALRHLVARLTGRPWEENAEAEQEAQPAVEADEQLPAEAASDEASGADEGVAEA